ncbi:MAG: pyridoxamine 5'-phosphate oxidase family protein [Polyangiaceae bacterium]|nr:pyridoxamine 5'-phosphate oxidase family protein [Polyangiaceae bacterium]
MTSFDPTGRTTLRRRKERGSYDRDTIHAVIDEALVCHVGFVHDGYPFVMPTAHVRVGESVYLHGALRGRMLDAVADGACLTFTLLDGLVLGRSAMHHSMNYRSVVVLARGRDVTAPDEKLAVLTALVERFVPGRSREVRPPSEAELTATRVVAFAIEEASAKVRTGPPVDLASDLDAKCWAGVIPLAIVAGQPQPDPLLGAGVARAPRI